MRKLFIMSLFLTHSVVYAATCATDVDAMGGAGCGSSTISAAASDGGMFSSMGYLWDVVSSTAVTAASTASTVAYTAVDMAGAGVVYVSGGRDLELEFNLKAELLKALAEDARYIDVTFDYPLIRAVLEKNSKRVSALLEKNRKQIDATDDNGWTSLHHACNQNSAQMVRLLLMYGADMNARNSSNETPLEIAVKKKCTDVINVLAEVNPLIV